MEGETLFLEDRLDYGLVFERLVSDLDRYTSDCGLESVVLGVSGGIDSTVVAAIASEVADRKTERGEQFRLVGITMPTSTTQEIELSAARKVLESFCGLRREINIDCFSEGIIRALVGRGPSGDAYGNPGDEWTDKLRSGNIKSRLRTVILYDAAKSCRGLVLGTDNMSEHMLGFSTIGGDALYDYCPIQELWKTEVFGLAGYLKDMYSAGGGAEKSLAISCSLSLKPMDGLGISSDDMEQIGAKDYYEADRILKGIYRSESNPELDGLSLGSMKIDGIPDGTVSKVLSRCLSNRYKRNLPVYPEREGYSSARAGISEVLEGMDGGSVLDTVAELGEYQKASGLPFSYRTRDELEGMLKSVLSDGGPLDNYPNMMEIRRKTNGNG